MNDAGGSNAGEEMKSSEEYKAIFDKYNGLARTQQLQEDGLAYRPLQKLIEQGYVEKVRYGYYRWVNHDDFSEAGLIKYLFPDAVLCLDTALRYYGYSDRTPGEWHLAVDKYSGRSRFNIDYPFVKPYYLEPSTLELGLTEGDIDGHTVRIYDRERTICDCLRYRNKMDKEIFNKAIRAYIDDPGKNIPKLMEYAGSMRVKKTVKDLIGVWL